VPGQLAETVMRDVVSSGVNASSRLGDEPPNGVGVGGD